jgi:hypothetical protein
MKKVIVLGLLFVMVVVSAFAETTYKDACRKILYAVKPIEAIKAVDNEALRNLARFAFGIGLGTQESLNETDSYLFSWLANTEFARREKAPDDFSLYLQERKESNDPYYAKGDSDAIKINTWIDLYKLDLMFAE